MPTTEVPSQASPRVIPFSAHNRQELRSWYSCHDKLKLDAESYTPAESRRLVLFGDSITESWRGTSYCRGMPRTKGVPAALNDTLGVKWPAPVALGIAADCTQHLLWRLQNGELTPLMSRDPKLTMVLLIGTNNLGHGDSVDATTEGILAVSHALLNNTRASLLVNALLPRGDRRKRRKKVGASLGFGYSDDIVAVNAAVKAAVATQLEGAYPGRSRFVDCGGPFLAPSAKGTAASIGLAAAGGTMEPAAIPPQTTRRPEFVRRELMPDRLHPNAAGHRLWGACLSNALGGSGW